MSYSAWQRKRYGRHYTRWQSMKQRCLNPRNPYYKYYGGRGIGICRAWLEFAAFQAWCESTYVAGRTLDRKDNSRGYSPSNCRWVTHKVQIKNSRMTPARIAARRKNLAYGRDLVRARR